MTTAHSRHVKVTSEMRTFAAEISTAFKPTAEEQLLGILTYALESCYRRIPDRIATASESLDSLLRFALAELVSRKHKAVPEEGPSSPDWAALFARDFFQGPGGSSKGRLDAHARLERQCDCLRKWIASMERLVRVSVPNRLRVEDYSPKLLSMDLSEMQLHISAGEPVPMATVWPAHQMDAPERVSLRQSVERSRPLAPTLHMVLPEMSAMTRNGRRLRRLWMTATNGARRGYAIESRALGHRERARHLGSVIEFLLASSRGGREWVIPPYFPADLPVSAHLALVEDDASSVPLGEIFEEHLERREAGSESLLTLYLRALGTSLDASPSPANKVQAFLALSEGSNPPVGEGILVHYVNRLFHDVRSVLAFRKAFTNHLANVSTLGWALGVPSARPGSLLIHRSLGRVLHTDFWPARAEGHGPGWEESDPESAADMPFRLTRNLAALVTPFGIEGNFARTMAGLGTAVSHRKGFALSHLTLFFRDDTIAWTLHSATHASPPLLDCGALMATAEGRAHAAAARFASVDPSRGVPDDGAVDADEAAGAGSIRSPAGAAIDALVQAASSVNGLARADLGFHPWF